MDFTLILLVVALVCFILAVFNVNIRAINLVALGLACWVATLILPLLH